MASRSYAILSKFKGLMVGPVGPVWGLALIWGVFAGWGVGAETLYPGPIVGQVKRVIDGDTLVVDAYIWPNTQASDVAIRIRGIDTPERRGKCQKERDLAERAKQLMAQAFPVGRRVYVYQVEAGKYGGRFIAAVRRDDGRDWANYIQQFGLAAPYQGRGAKRDWCSSN